MRQTPAQEQSNLGCGQCLYVQLQTDEGRAGVPLALVGSGLGGDCAPKAANFRYSPVEFTSVCTPLCTPVPSKANDIQEQVTRVSQASKP